MALGLVVRHAFHGNTEHFEVASSTMKMKKVLSKTADLSNLAHRGTKEGASPATEGIELVVTDSTLGVKVSPAATASLPRGPPSAARPARPPTMPKAPRPPPGIAKPKKAATDTTSSAKEAQQRELVNLMKNDNEDDKSVVWDDLCVVLSMPRVMANMLKIRSLESIGLDVLHGATETGGSTDLADRGKQQPAALDRRVFGWDHKVSQFVLFFKRYWQKRYRARHNWYMDVFVLFLGALVMGAIVGNKGVFENGPLNNLMIVLVYGTLSAVGSLNTFSSDKLIFWRESSQNASIFGVWLSRNAVDLLFICFQTLVFSGIVYDLTIPRMNISTFWWIYWSIAIANSGLGYLLSTFIPRRNLTLYGALTVVLIGAFFSGILPYMRIIKTEIIQSRVPGSAVGGAYSAKVKFAIASVSYSRWAVEALVTTELMKSTRGLSDIAGENLLRETGMATLFEYGTGNNESVSYVAMVPVGCTVYVVLCTFGPRSDACVVFYLIV